MSLSVGSWATTGRPYRIAAAMTAILVVFGGWAYLYVKSRAVDLRAASEAMTALRELKEIDSRWNDWLIRTGLEAAADASAGRAAARPSVEPTRVRRLLAMLALEAHALANPLPPTLVSGLRQAFDEKAATIDEFGAAASATGQGLAAFAQAGEAFGAFARERAAGIPPGVFRDAEVARAAVLAHAAQPGTATLRSAQAAIARFTDGETPESARADVDRLAAAAMRALESGARKDALFRQAYFASTGPRLESATRAVEQAFGESVGEAERYRWYLLVYSGLVVVLAAWLALRLTATYRAISKLNRKLHEANDFLEHRVAERTRDLKNAMDQLKEQEALLIQSEKMSSLGQMVAGVAHEVNTPLAYVKSSLEAVAGGMPKVEEALARAERLVELLRSDTADERALAQQFAAVDAALGAMRSSGPFADIGKLVGDGLYGIAQIGELVTNLRNFARLDRSKVADFDLNEGIAAALTIARNSLKSRTVRKNLGAIPHVSCSPSQINQVFLNLLTNAAQATPDQGGVIGVRTWQPDPAHVAVEITDNGHGIPPEVLPRIFDPFFTTKEVGKGTGLGLSICYKIVESHGGRIDVDSRVGVGTRFIVTLPLKPPAAAAERAAA